MHNCHQDILDYHDENVTLSMGERSKMRNRRNANRNRIKKNLNDEDPKLLGFQTQGSYSMLTMVLDPNNDYDIDDGVYLLKDDLKGSQGADLTPRKVKQIICDAAQDSSFKLPPEVRTNCVRVYYNDGSHVDIPVYRKVVEEDFWGDETITYEIAGSDWKQSDPKSVTTWFNEDNIKKSPDITNGRQMRRIVRLMKKFARSRDSWKSRIASGFIITKLISECYVQNSARDDKALYDTMKAIRDRLENDLEVDHPVLDEKLTKGPDDSKTKFFREKLKDHLDKLDDLFDKDCDDAMALEAWGRVYGSTFFFNRAQDARDKAKAVLAASINSLSDESKSDHADKAFSIISSESKEYQPWAVSL